MADEADAGKVRRGYRLPRMPVASRDELGALFAQWDRRLKLRAHRRFRQFHRPVIDASLRDAMAAMLNAETVAFDNPLQKVLHDTGLALQREERRRRRLAKYLAAGVPVDPVLGRIEGVVADAVMRLPLRWRDAVLRHGSGDPLKEIAESQGTSVGAVKSDLDQARKLARSIMQNGHGGHSAGVFLGGALGLPRRLRSLLRGASGAAHLPSAGSLLPVVVCSFFASGALPAPVAQAATAVRPVPATTMAGFGSGRGARSYETPSAWSAAETVGPTVTPTVAAARPAGHRAADETPEDVTLTSAATPSAGHGAVVAIGIGHTCACPVLMRSLDGGVTWTATEGPPQDATQLVVPPDYPRDPRIFAGVDAFDASGNPYMSAGFGAPFQQLIGLPPGHIAVSSAFDSGDLRVFSASLAGVWSLRLGALVPHLEVGYPSALSIAVATLATPPPGGAAVLMWAPVGSVSGTSLPSLGSPVFRCPVTGACVQAATLPVTPGSIVAGSGGAVVAYQYNLAYLSRDGGRTFTQLPMPKDIVTVASVGLTGSPSIPWASLTRLNGTAEVVQYSVSHVDWAETAGANFGAHFAVGLIAVRADRVIAILQGAGYRCTAVGTGVWLPRCPA